MRYEDGAKIYESTEEVTEDSVGRGYTLIIEPSETLMERVQWEWNRLESGCSLQAEASRLRTSLTPSRQHDSRNLSSRLELTLSSALLDKRAHNVYSRLTTYFKHFKKTME